MMSFLALNLQVAEASLAMHEMPIAAAAKEIAIRQAMAFPFDVCIGLARPHHHVGRKVEFLNTSTGAEIDQAFVALTERRADALFISADPFFVGRMDQLAALTIRDRIPATFVLRAFPAAGGLMSYGTSINDAYRQAGVYTALILKGAKPADLPVTQSTRFELVINLKTAQALGVTIPPGVLAIADEVIE